MSSTGGSPLGGTLLLPGPGGGGSGFLTVRGVLGGGAGMNSMEEDATQLESEVLRKILRHPKESAHGEAEGCEDEARALPPALARGLPRTGRRPGATTAPSWGAREAGEGPPGL